MKAQARFDAASGTLAVGGIWRADSAVDPPASRATVARIEGAALEHLDTNGAWLLLEWLPDEQTALPELAGLSASQRGLIEAVWQHRGASRPRPAPAPMGVREFAGRGAVGLWQNLVGLVGFIGLITVETSRLLARPAQWRMREFAAQLRDIFVGAIPIIAAMLFLLGIVFAYLLGAQAQRVGANIFVVDGLLAAILREISPVIVAILVAGRSGAAITAQLGAMRVNEEIDALVTLGRSPVAVLVIPRLLALIVALPLLVFIGNIAGIAGGMVVAEHQLGISPHMFTDRLMTVLKLKTLLIGLVKAPVFALFIALIACRMGLAVGRDARSVGANTTSTVVQCLVAIILLDALFAIALVNLRL